MIGIGRDNLLEPYSLNRFFGVKTCLDSVIPVNGYITGLYYSVFLVLQLL